MDGEGHCGLWNKLCQSEMNPALVHTAACFKSIGLMQIRALTHSFHDFKCSVGVNKMPFPEARRLCSENYLAQSCKQVRFWQLAYTVNEWVAFRYSSNYHHGAVEQGTRLLWQPIPTRPLILKKKKQHLKLTWTLWQFYQISMQQFLDLATFCI